MSDIEVRITCRQALSVEVNRLGHRKCLDSERISILVTHLAQQREVFLKGLIVRLGRILLRRNHNRIDVGEASKIIYVPMGVVTSNSVTKP